LVRSLFTYTEWLWRKCQRDLIVSASARKVRTKMCQFWTFTEIELFGSGAHCYSFHIRFSLMRLDEERNLQKKFGHRKQIFLSHSGSCCPPTEMWSTQKKKPANFTHKLQRVLRLTVVYFYIYCGMLTYFSLLCNKFVI
jgi:hypothetical protein